MSNVLDDKALDQLFREARTHGDWLDKPVSDETLRQLYDVMKWGPTSANGSPARLVFIRSREAKERLRPTLAPGNVEMIGASERVSGSETQGRGASLTPTLKVKQFHFTSQSEAV